MHISREACRAARVGLGWTRAQLAKEAGLGERTIIDFERGARDPHENNKAAIRGALERGGVSFSSENCICLPALSGEPEA